MSKVYIVTAFTGVPYEDHSWVDSVYDTLDKAKKYLEDNPGSIGQNLKEYDYGYYLSTIIKEIEVQ